MVPRELTCKSELRSPLQETIELSGEGAGGLQEEGCESSPDLSLPGASKNPSQMRCSCMTSLGGIPLRVHPKPPTLPALAPDFLFWVHMGVGGDGSGEQGLESNQHPR